MTFVSRLFGLLRDAVIVVLFPSSGTDAFFVAFRIPNFLRRLFAEGAFAQAFVPIFSEYREQREFSELKQLVNHVSGSLTLILSLVTLIGIITAPFILLIFAPGFADDAARFELTTQMLRITFPYILFISLTALAGGILNSFGKFAVPAFTPVFLNLSMIGAAIFLAPRMQTPIIALAWGVFIAGFVQLLFQLPYLYRLGLLPRLKFRTAHEGVQRILKLMLPAIFGSSVVQINLLFDTLIASFLAVGSVSWLYISDRFVELPLAIFGIATATVILPRLSRQRASGSDREFHDTLDWALKLSVLIALPATLGIMLLAGPILVTLVQYREFDSADTQMASLSLIALSAGLPAFTLIKILAPGFYSRQDTRTPVRIGIISMLANMVLNVIFVVSWVHSSLPGPHAGLAAATTLSAYLNAGMLYRTLKKQGIYQLNSSWAPFVLRVATACITMLLVLVFLIPELSQWNTWSLGHRLFSLLSMIAVGGVSYLCVLLVAGVRPAQFRMS